MKLLLNNKKDLCHIYGRFILTLNHDNPIYLNELKPSERDFYFVKRVRFVLTSPYTPDDAPMKVLETDLFGNSYAYSIEDYLKHFNEPYGGTRFNRILKGEELDILFAWMRERNY